MDVIWNLLRDPQPNYALQIANACNVLVDLLGPEPFVNVDQAGLTHRLASVLESKPLSVSARLTVINALFALRWWSGVPVDDRAYGRLGGIARAAVLESTDALSAPSRSGAKPAAKRAHAVFVGQLQTPLHSPTAGAVEYLRGLAADPDNRRIDVFYGSEIGPELLQHMRERLDPIDETFSFCSMEQHGNFAVVAAALAPCTYHFWCEAPLHPHISYLAQFGPTVMFTCGDEPPIQYADAYWFSHEPAYMQAMWRRKGVPESFISNYVQTFTAPYVGPAMVKARSKADLGLAPDETLIATVGNRLAVDMDETFINGMEAMLRADSSRRWLSVGPLPDYLLSALQQVLGPQFMYIEYDTDLAGLMQAVDVFANPFRQGGGYTSVIAIESGAVVLTRCDVGDVGSCVPAEHLADNAEDYFLRLEMLIDSVELRRSQGDAQRARHAQRFDQTRVPDMLRDLTAAAYERFKARAGRREVIFGGPRQERAA